MDMIRPIYETEILAFSYNKFFYMKLHSRKQDLGESDMRYFKGKQFK